MTETPPTVLSPDHITREAITAWAGKYPSILTRVYATKNPKLSAKEALEEDEWRYNTLPELLSDGSGMTKQQLARLVKWKITHGVYRPFLPSMIQKNAEADIVKHTSRAAAILRGAKNSNNNNTTNDEAYKVVEAALKEVTNLTGVGPATGTLVLSVYSAEDVPFFADELFAWAVPRHTAKLKYDKKEYAALWGGVRAVQRRVGKGAREVEKAAYAIRHMDVLGEGERDEMLRGLLGGLEEEGGDRMEKKKVEEEEDDDGEANTAGERVENGEDGREDAGGESKKGQGKAKRRREIQSGGDGARRSKRIKG